MAGADVVKSSELGARILVGVALAGAATLALFIGGIAFWAFIAAMALIVMAEWAGLMKADPFRTGLAVLTLAVPFALAAPMWWGTDRSTVALLVSLAIVFFAFTGRGALSSGIVYIGLPAIGILHLRAQPEGIALALWTLVIVVATDTGAFFAGRALGGPRLAPRFSPKKTWSGLGGGMVAAALCGAAIGVAGHLPAPTLWLGAPLAILAQVGDLFESWLKRRARVKDSGRLLPGHGGFLDRVDGAIPVVTIVAALVAGGAL